jgi:hypothetical protein
MLEHLVAEVLALIDKDGFKRIDPMPALGKSVKSLLHNVVVIARLLILVMKRLTKDERAELEKVVYLDFLISPCSQPFSRMSLFR